mgnify:CR=1 FL=1
MAGIIFDPKRIDECGDEFIDVDDVVETQKRVLTLYSAYAEADGTDVVGCGVVVHRTLNIN